MTQVDATESDNKPKPSKLKRLARIALDLFLFAGVGRFQDFLVKFSLKVQVKSL